MSNKTQLQLNNETLDSILSNVLGLPSQESLKHGAYVWKKYERTVAEKKIVKETEFTATSDNPLILDENVGSYVYKASSFTTDDTNETFTLVSASKILNNVLDEQAVAVYDGSYLTYNSATSNRMFKAPTHSSYGINFKGDGSGKVKVWVDSTSYPAYMYEYVDDIIDTFVDYVVSDNPTAYPDGGEQDGYWYVMIGYEKGEIIPTANISELVIPTNLKNITKVIVTSDGSNLNLGTGSPPSYPYWVQFLYSQTDCLHKFTKTGDYAQANKSKSLIKYYATTGGLATSDDELFELADGNLTIGFTSTTRQFFANCKYKYEIFGEM